MTLTKQKNYGMTKILSVKDLVIKFYTFDGVVHALNNVSFDLDEGETPISLHAKVRAIDGRIGEVSEFIVDHATWQITHLVIRKGLPWGKKQVSIPITAIDCIGDNKILLTLKKDDVKKLPETPVGK
jgi:sporulation protein YlmC with PRC-barrel domain